ncbi:MAG: MFS transporter [Vicinamibacterales bacterium]
MAGGFLYQSQGRTELNEKLRSPNTRRLGLEHAGRNVWILGLTSLLTDASSEMVAAILPLYALYFLHASPAMFGVLDGLQQGGASLVKLAAGWFTDRSQRHKSVAAAGYLASAASKLGLLVAAGGASALTALVVLDRVGKGIRTAPRDAIISLSVPRGALASAFGIHRALDTTGAMLGPLLAFLVLRWIADGYDVVFAISLALALVGAAALVLFVDTSLIAAAPAGQSEPALRWWTPRFIMIAVLAGVFGLATISDAFIYLSLQRKLGFDHAYLPLLFVATPAVYLTLAIPFGRIADRVGRSSVIVAGYSALLLLYVILSSTASSLATIALCVFLLGSFYAMTDGVFAALASSELPPERRATGLALVSTCNDVGRLISSVFFGWMWSRSSPDAAARAFIPLMVVTLVLAAVVIWRFRTNAR